MPPIADDFRAKLRSILRNAALQSLSHVDVRAGELHRLVGDYPDQRHHRMPMCCAVMRQEMKMGDSIMSEPPKGQGASLTIRYTFPRP